MPKMIQLSIFNEEPTDNELVNILSQYGWKKTNYWADTEIHQFKKGGNVSNLTRDQMEDLIEKEQLIAKGEHHKALNLVPRQFRYLYQNKTKE